MRVSRGEGCGSPQQFIPRTRPWVTSVGHNRAAAIGLRLAPVLSANAKRSCASQLPYCPFHSPYRKCIGVEIVYTAVREVHFSPYGSMACVGAQDIVVLAMGRQTNKVRRS